MKAKKFTEAVALENQGEHEFFIEESRAKVQIYRGSVCITDLTNAMKVGKRCESFSFHMRREGHWHPYNLLGSFGFSLEKMFEFARALPWEKVREGWWKEAEVEMIGEEGPFYVCRNEAKSVRVYSPYSIKEMKPLKEEPKKWTVRHALRALFNGQIEYVRCRGVYTDDYAFDAAYNYQQGQLEPESFAREIMESPSGWWASARYNAENVVSICCHSFNSNEFKFKLS